MLEFGLDVKPSYTIILNMAFLSGVDDDIKESIVKMAAKFRETLEDPKHAQVSQVLQDPQAP